ncbi:MAG TPA: hypothetical protein VJ821_12080 [Anaerolineales bacterium]|nr:hypothetical protein [Anaerolineales bacterium]
MSSLPQKVKQANSYCFLLFLVSFFTISCNGGREGVRPTITPISINQTEPECARSKFDVAMVGSPAFCVVWVDNFQNETGFQIDLSYLDSGEIFVYEVGPDVTQVLVPEEHRPTDSQGNCIRTRQVFDANVIALLDSGNVQVGSIGGQGECWISTPTP